MLGADTNIAALEIKNDFKTIHGARVFQNTCKRRNARWPVPLKACCLNLDCRHDARHCVNDSARKFADGDRRSRVTRGGPKNGGQLLCHRIKTNTHGRARGLNPSKESVGSIYRVIV
jgi:hypothetical protein